MDPVTHLASGVMGSLVARRWFPEAKYFIPFCMLAAWIPDGDIFFGNGDPEFSLLHHRGITTSFFGGFFLALIIAILYKAVSPRTSTLKATLLAYSLVLTHVWLDLITAYGTQILAPFSNHRFALDGAFIIDPLFTGFALLLLIFSIFARTLRRRLGIIGMVWFFAYPVMNMGISAHLETVYAEKLDTLGIPYSTVCVTPDALAPRYWKVITTSGQDYIQDTIDLFGKGHPVPPERFRRADNGELARLGEIESMFATYDWFARWPYIIETDIPGGKKILFGDLRFWSTNPVMVSIFKDREPPFTLTAFIDSEGNLTGWQFIKGASSIGETAER